MKKNALSPLPSHLLPWYDANARVLPWRDNPTPYRVWISEIMLQQTRVEAVKPYFERFVTALPDVYALACVEDGRLLKLWEGLGYYSRAKNLKKAARMIAEQFGGTIPSDTGELMKLPGIGPYSAGAIASIAYGVRAPAIDGNVLRVISRLTAFRGDIGEPKTKKQIENQVIEILPTSRVGDFNQALMELGATVCLPNGVPDCGVCPLKELCRANHLGITSEIPVKTKKSSRRLQDKTVFVIIRGDKLAVRLRPDSGLLPGLWELPNADGNLGPKESEKLLQSWGIVPANMEKLSDAVHIFTHIEWCMCGYQILVEGMAQSEEFQWVGLDDLEKGYALPAAFRVYKKAALQALKSATHK